jgi:hypothetical protein
MYKEYEMKNEILDYLAEAEGLTVHKNKGEEDITSPYGIYKHIHPDAKIFEYIDSLLLELSIQKNTKKLEKKELEKLNNKIKTTKFIQDNIRDLAWNFYEDYFSNLYLSLFPKEAVISFLSMYTTSSEAGIMSTQKAINDVISNGFISSEGLKSKYLSEDGIFGNESRKGLAKINQLYKDGGIFVGYWFEEKMIKHMILYYDELAIEKPEKFKKFYKGWRNRMEKLSDTA